MSCSCYGFPATAARVNLSVANNGTWQDAFQIGVVGDTTWDLNGQSFIMEVKASVDDVAPLLTISTALGSIVVDDVVKRIIHLNVPEADIVAALPVGEYVYDLVMFDGSTPPIRVPLMFGRVEVGQGVTRD